MGVNRAAAMGGQEQHRIPIVLGITGHRDLRPQDLPELSRVIGSIIKELQSLYPSTPLTMLSPLAEGADRLAARAALDQGADLAVPLPREAGDYEKDFTTKESCDEFRELMAKACHSFVVGSGGTREDGYAAAGAFIAAKSHILIALWDGVDSGLAGGTSEVVRFKLEGLPASISEGDLLDPVDNSPVYHIVTPRDSNPQPVGQVFSLQKCFPGTGTDINEREFASCLRHIDEYNADALRLLPQLEETFLVSKNYVIPEAQRGLLSLQLQDVLDSYALADTLALHFQKRRRLTLLGLFTLAVLAFLFFEVYAHLWEKPLLLALYPATMLLALVLYRWARTSRYQDKHLDYRALAEGMRVQLFWLLAGMREDVSQYYLRKQKSELDWIRKAIQSAELLIYKGRSFAADDIPGDTKKKYGLVYEHWVKDQCTYFAGAAQRDRGRLRVQEYVALILVCLGLVLAAGVVLTYFGLLPHADANEHKLMVVIMGLAPAVAAAFEGYAEKMVYAAQARKYERVYTLFDRAAHKLKAILDTDDLDEGRLLIFELGKEALAENGDWVMMHRERPMKVPVGG